MMAGEPRVHVRLAQKRRADLYPLDWSYDRTLGIDEVVRDFLDNGGIGRLEPWEYPVGAPTQFVRLSVNLTSNLPVADGVVLTFTILQGAAPTGLVVVYDAAATGIRRATALVNYPIGTTFDLLVAGSQTVAQQGGEIIASATVDVREGA